MGRILLLAALPLLAAAANWPQWRGPSNDGMAVGDAPLKWSDTEHVKWRAEIPGRGHSSPVVWGNRVFVTTAIGAPTMGQGPGGRPPRPDGPPPDGDRPPPPRDGRPPRRPPPGGPRGGLRGGGPPDGPQSEQQWALLCLDRATGKVIWQRTAVKAVPHQGHRPGDGSFANESPVTDGKHVIAYFGSRGIYCYDMDGNPVWKKELGVKFDIFHQYGEGTSPVLDGERLLIKGDHEGESFLMVLNKSTGEQIWRVKREERTSHSVPLVITFEGRKQIITTATNRIRSYDYQTGAVIWECGGLGMNAIPAPVVANGILYAMTGYQEPKLLAIRLGGKGDITGSERVLWSVTRDNSYVPSPLVHDGRLYVVRDGGFLTAYDAASGKPVYQSVRVLAGHTFKASPVGANGKLYLASEQDDVIVVKMGDKPEVLAVNTLKDQVFVASPAIVDGEIFLRGAGALFCIR